MYVRSNDSFVFYPCRRIFPTLARDTGRQRYSCTQLGANVELDTFYTYDELDRTFVRSFFLDREPGFTGFWLVRRPTLTRHIAAYFPFKATEIDPLS